MTHVPCRGQMAETLSSERTSDYGLYLTSLLRQVRAQELLPTDKKIRAGMSRHEAHLRAWL